MEIKNNNGSNNDGSGSGEVNNMSLYDNEYMRILQFQQQQQPQMQSTLQDQQIPIFQNNNEFNNRQNYNNPNGNGFQHYQDILPPQTQNINSSVQNQNRYLPVQNASPGFSVMNINGNSRSSTSVLSSFNEHPNGAINQSKQSGNGINGMKTRSSSGGSVLSPNSLKNSVETTLENSYPISSQHMFAPQIISDENSSAINNKTQIENELDLPQLSSMDIKARKKAQNRAAQKAFRERKEARLKELESKLIESEKNRHFLLKEIEKLKKLNTEISAENRLLLRKNNNNNNNNIENKDNNNILSSSNISSPSSNINSNNNINLSSDSLTNTNSNFSFPTEDEFYETMITNSIHKPRNSSIANGANSKRRSIVIPDSKFIDSNVTDQYLSIPATWEYLYKLSEERDFDIYYVMQKLKGEECSDELGPSYRKSMIDKIVEHGSID